MTTIPSYLAAALPNNEEPGYGKYSYAWRTHTSPTTPGVPQRGTWTGPRRMLRSDGKPTVWAAGRFSVPKTLTTQVRGPLNMHPVGGYPGWNGVAAFAIDLYPGEMSFAFNAGGTWIIRRDHIDKGDARPTDQIIAQFPDQDTFSMVTTTDLRVPMLPAVDYDVVLRLVLDPVAGELDAYVNGKLVVSKKGLPTSLPGDPAVEAGAQQVQFWEGIYDSRQSGQQQGNSLSHTAWRFGPTLAQCLADVPVPVDYWYSKGLGSAASSSSVAGKPFDVSLFTAPPLTVAVTTLDPRDAQIKALKAQVAARDAKIAAAKKALG